MLRNYTNATSMKGLVSGLMNAGAFSSPSVQAVMESVDRAFYAKTNPYMDSPQPINYNATISAPHIHACVLELISDHVKGEDKKILDVGSGSGYLTVCMAKLAGSNSIVIGVDHIQELVDAAVENIMNDKENSHLLQTGKVRFAVGDGRIGVPSEAPFDLIHIGAACPTLPTILLDQLKVGGMLIAPVGRDFQRLCKYLKKEDGSLQEEHIATVMFVPLTDKEAQLKK